MNSRKNVRRDRRQGFTLIELLTVVSIIGLLLAILLPSLQQARRTADRIGCATQLRRIGVAMHMYHDTHGLLPGPTNARQNFYPNQGPAFPNPTTGRASAQQARNLYPFMDLPAYQPWMRETEVDFMRCPAHRRMLGDARAPDYPHPLYAICYIANRSGPRALGNVNADMGTHPEQYWPKPLTGVLSLSRIWTIMDADSAVYMVGNSQRRMLNDFEPPFVPVHGTVRMVLFLDGHVEAYAAELGPPPTPAR